MLAELGLLCPEASSSCQMLAALGWAESGSKYGSGTVHTMGGRMLSGAGGLSLLGALPCSWSHLGFLPPTRTRYGVNLLSHYS